jgi:hypothetical protein
MKKAVAESIRRTRALALSAVGASVLFACVGSAQALGVQECVQKYKAAKAANSLNGLSWNDFRKAECGADASAPTPPAAQSTPATPATPADPAAPVNPLKPTGQAAKPASPAPSAADAVFPSQISSKYASEPISKARMHTCLDQYKANQSAKANGGLSWIMKGGGYYSECNKRLKQ